jgi:hypothetical protein
MFVQVIRGKVRDQERLAQQLDRWQEDVAPKAEGWLGYTHGVTDDGTALSVVRFESLEAAEANAERPEQGAWWEETARCFEGEPSFFNSTFVDLDTPGDPGRAGFVQVMQGQVTDPDRARELMNDDSVDMSDYRPDILGSLMCGHDDGRWTMTIWFTSEAEAREGEQKNPPEEWSEVMQELDRLSVGDTSYFDLREPRMRAPD